MDALNSQISIVPSIFFVSLILSTSLSCYVILVIMVLLSLLVASSILLVSLFLLRLSLVFSKKVPTFGSSLEYLVAGAIPPVGGVLLMFLIVDMMCIFSSLCSLVFWCLKVPFHKLNLDIMILAVLVEVIQHPSGNLVGMISDRAWVDRFLRLYVPFYCVILTYNYIRQNISSCLHKVFEHLVQNCCLFYCTFFSFVEVIV